MLRVDARDARLRRQDGRLRGEDVREDGRAGARAREDGDDVFRAVALQGVRGGARRYAVVVETEAAADDRLLVRGVGKAETRRDVVGVGLNRVGQELQVVAQAEVERQVAAHFPFVLREEAEVRVLLRLRRLAERLLELAVIAGQEVREIRERVDALQRAGEVDVQVVVEKFAADFERVVSAHGAEVVRQLIKVNVALGRRGGRRAEARHAGDVDGRPRLVDGGRGQTAAP